MGLAFKAGPFLFLHIYAAASDIYLTKLRLATGNKFVPTGKQYQYTHNKPLG